MSRRMWVGASSALVVLALMFGLGPGEVPETLAQSRTLKFQASWPSGLTLYDNFEMFADKVYKMSGGG